MSSVSQAARKEAESRLIYALDVASGDEAVELVAEQGKHHPNLIYKVGITLFFSESGGWSLIKRLFEAGAKRIFLDLKLHDIAVGQVDKAIRVLHGLAEYGVEFLSVHASEGDKALEAYQAAAGPFKLLGITVLTDKDAKDMEQAGITTPIPDLVMARAGSAIRAGIYGIVCSGKELDLLRGVRIPKVVPGIRPTWAASAGGQKRIVTPAAAIEGDAEFLVVGRPMRDGMKYGHDSRVAATAAVIDEMASAL